MNGLTYFLGSGDVQLALLTAAGAFEGFDDAVNCTKFELNVESEVKKVKSRMRDTDGQTLASATRITDSKVAMVFNGVSPSLFASVFLGDAVALTGTSGTVTAEAVTALAGKWTPVANLGSGISAVIVKDATDVTTYVAATDYSVDLSTGMIKVLAGGAIADKAVLHIDYAYAAESGYKIVGTTRPLVKVMIKFSGKNVYNGDPASVDVFEANLRPSSAVDFMSEDTQELEFEGDLITPAGKLWPFEVR